MYLKISRKEFWRFRIGMVNSDAKKCTMERELPTCAHCDDFPSCDKEIWTKWPELNKKTKEIRRRIRN